MRSHNLRRFRILFSAIVLICFVFVFIDFKNLVPSKYINILLSLQFIPSFMKFYDIGTLASAGFIAVLILTFLTGRTYCSFLCPLGAGQDLNSRIGGKIRKKFRRYGFKKPFTITRYTLLGATIIVTIIWGIYLLTLLDPYSIFGRFMTHFGKPVTIVLNNFVAWVLHKFDVYTFDHI
ncbi:MAG: 4Fe-4S binding protein, partial [Bacteroidia bacterium]|nr:4Fe-4S binding protein [Bacteroidia bacterium]